MQDNSIRLALRCSLVSCGTFAGGRRYKLCFPRSRIFCQSSITAEACAVPITVVPVPVPVPIAVPTVPAVAVTLLPLLLTYVLLLFVTVPPVHYSTVELRWWWLFFLLVKSVFIERKHSVLLGPPSPRLLSLSLFPLTHTHTHTHSLSLSPLGRVLSNRL